MALQSTQVLLAERPVGVPLPEHFRLDTQPCDPLGAGEVRIEVAALGIDAFIRTALEEGSFHRSVPVGGLVSALGVGTVVDTAFDALEVGSTVFGPMGAQTVATLPGAVLQPIDATDVGVTAHLGALGLSTGVTAYAGMQLLGVPRPDDMVVVTAAAGAVGSTAAQIARIAGATVIGIAGGPHKATFLTDELGLAAAIDYKNDDVAARLRELAPDGVDVFFDNVGNPILDIVIDQIADRARIVICGAIAQYGNMDAVDGPANYLRIAERCATLHGFTVNHFAEQWPQASAQLRAWLLSGDLVMRETFLDGIDRFPEALATLFSGGHVGKLMVRP
ncbi:MAG: NADP-dependent oxidoreductase [Actinomycetota bacterium]